MPVGQPVRGALADEPAVGSVEETIRSSSPPATQSDAVGQEIVSYTWSPDGTQIAFVSDRVSKSGLFVLPIGGENSSAQEVHFASVPNGVSIKATLEPHAFGTEIQMYVKGMPSGTLCRVFLRDAAGRTYSAGSFRYRWEEGSEAHLSSGLDLSQAAEIGLHAGGRTFVAPVSQATALVSGAEIDPA